MTAAPEPPAADPITVLLGEHRTILQVLDEVDRESRRLETDGVLREAFWHDLLQFADVFDAGVHHKKEEALLFPALERAGLSASSGPTAVLRDEHGRIQFARDRLASALQARDRLRLVTTVASYVDRVRSHVLKENQILFPLARRLLARDELDGLAQAFLALRASTDVGLWLAHPLAFEAGA